MVVYYEELFLADSLADGLILCVCTVVLNERFNWFRLVFSSALGGACTLLSVCFPPFRWGILFLYLLIVPFFIRKITGGKVYFLSVMTFLSVSAVLAGLYVLSVGLGLYDLFFFGVPHAFVSLIGILLILSVKKLLSYGSRTRRTNGCLYDVYLSSSGVGKTFRGFYDSGNRAYTDAGEKVIFVPPSVYSILSPIEEEPYEVLTAGGIFSTQMTGAEATVFFPEGAVTYQVKAALGKKLFSDRVILHSEMTGGL